MISTKTIDRIRAQAHAAFHGSKGSHDWEHTLRVYGLAVHIAKKEKADMDVVRLAAILHDIARSIEDSSNGRVDHARQGALMAMKILMKNKVPLEKTANIIHCIASHRFRGKLKPRTKEAKCLFDADKLDSIGAVGIGRAFLFAGEVGAKLHNKGVDISRTRPYTEEDTAYREFMVKLRKVKSRILTKEGKKLATKRHVFMVEFFKRLDEEARGRA